MKGLIASTLVVPLVAAGMASAAGTAYRDLVDPCYPERYEAMARREVLGAFAAQVQNGHVLDQTIWNSYFEPGTDRLTPAGMMHLNYLARRRPAPDCVVFVQESQDVPVAYDAEHPARFVEARGQLDARRVQAVQRYLEAYTAGRGQVFSVVMHDPPEVGENAIPVNVVVQKMNLSPPDHILVIYGGIRASGGR